MPHGIGKSEERTTRPATTPGASGGEEPLRFEELYARYFDFVWRSLRRLGVQPHALDDAAQDVFVVVHRRLADYRGGSARAWLFAVVQRVASDYRRKVRRKGGLLPLRDSIPAPAANDPFQGAQRAEATDVVLAFLQQLDEGRRGVFILSELEQMTAPEIGSALALNPSTVYSRIASARKEFVRFVEARHPEVAAARRKAGGGHG